MNRRDALTWIKIHIANGDEDLAQRIYTENRISYDAFRQAFEKGLQLRSLKKCPQL
jgi:hypothetical protein